MDRYSDLRNVVGSEFTSRLHTSRILVVGAGGIGCELLKNLVLSGFHDIEIIDLDTIDLSNLNRQFLFRKQHIDSPKAVIARETALKFNDQCSIKAYHGNIKESRFGFDYFKQFDLVLMALDNVEARRYVNRMCLSADIPLIESGTAGYLGQVQVIRKNKFECYECRPQPRTKSYAYCTIHNTPSKPIHCIVWSKIKFSDYFSDTTTNDNSLEDNNDEENTDCLENDNIMIEEDNALKEEYKLSKPKWLFRKLFHRDILQRCRLAELSGKDVWKGAKPTPLLPPTELVNTEKNSNESKEWNDQVVLGLDENISLFLNSCENLFKRIDDGSIVEWDKDDEDALNFVSSASNIRSHMFKIQLMSKFDIKAMAGNIIPAIATTNAIIAGLIVLEAFKVLNGNESKCKYTYLLRRPSGKRVLMDVALEKPNPSCYVCSSKQVQVKLDVLTTSLEFFVQNILQKELGMQYPCLFIGSDNIYECSEDMDEDEIEYMKEQGIKSLNNIGIKHGTTIRVDDDKSDISLDITVLHKETKQENEENESKDKQNDDDETEIIPYEIVKTSKENTSMLKKRKRTDENTNSSPEPPQKIQKK